MEYPCKKVQTTEGAVIMMLETLREKYSIPKEVHTIGAVFDWCLQDPTIEKGFACLECIDLVKQTYHLTKDAFAGMELYREYFYLLCISLHEHDS